MFFTLLFSADPVMAQVEETESGMQWYSLEEAQQKAKEEGKKVLIFGYADWCTYCRKMRKEVYPDTAVQNTIYRNFYPVQINTESEAKVNFNGTDMEEGELARYLRLSFLPTHYIINEDGDIMFAQPGFLSSEIFEPMLKYVGTEAYNEMDFEEFRSDKN
ncbi:MAG: thioredoxin fold domain-containing protein [Balneolaceae bacterium]